VAQEGKYLYCIIRCPEERPFDGPAIGDGGDGVHTICFHDLAAVVSDSAVTKYETSRQNLMAHQKVTERVMREFTVLPVRFGTVTNSASPVEDIRRLLQRRFKEFHGLLREMDNKVELGLKAIWRDEEAIFAEILAQRPEIRRLRDSMMNHPPAATHYERICLGEMVKAALDRKRDEEAKKILAPFRPIADRIQENKILMDKMVLNAALLVDKSREEECDEMVKMRDRQLGDRVILRYVGPTPPYNFVNIVVIWEELR